MLVLGEVVASRSYAAAAIIGLVLNRILKPASVFLSIQQILFSYGVADLY